MQRQFQVLALGRAFLDEVGVGHAFLHRGDKCQAVLRSAERQALGGERPPGFGGARAQSGFGAGRWVPGNHVQAMGQGAGDPAAANDAGTQGGEGFDVGNEVHGGLGCAV